MKKISLMGILLLAITGLFVLSTSICLAGAPKEIRIGVTAPLTGPAAEAGVALKQGMMMAVEEWNAKGGIQVKEAGKKLPVKILIEDCQSKPEIGVSVGEKLITRLSSIISSFWTWIYATMGLKIFEPLLSPGELE